jgi:hypothetical protein
LLCSGQAELRQRGYFDRYVAHLPPGSREVITSLVAGVWLPISVGMHHFAACDALGLSASEAFDLGAASGRRIQRSTLSTLVRLATGAGATPWTVLDGTYARLWQRIFTGGTLVIRKEGPKDATIAFEDVPPFRFAYFRNAFRGTNHAGLSLFASKLYVRELVERTSETAIVFRVAWV